MNAILDAETVRRLTAVKIEKNGDAAAADGKLVTQWMEVTPEMAARWLRVNFRNRPLKEDTVAAYAREIRNGAWQATHQGLAFDDQDKLIDGQHRLSAIVAAGRPVRMMVTFGLPARINGGEVTTMDCVDRGTTRSVADQLKIEHGLRNGGRIAAICRGLAGLCCGLRARRMSVGETLTVYRAFEAGVSFVVEHRSTKTGLRAAGVATAFAYVYDLLPESGELFTRLLAGELAGQPLLQELREFLLSDQAVLLSSSTDRGLAELTLQALFLGQRGEKKAKLKLSADGADHFRARQAARADAIAALFKLPGVAAVCDRRSNGAGNNGGAVSAPPPKIERPALGRVLAAVEHATKLGRIILAGRGTEDGIAEARVLFVTLARSYGHTPAAIAPLLRRLPENMAALTLPAGALPQKSRALYDALRARLSKP